MWIVFLVLVSLFFLFHSLDSSKTVAWSWVFEVVLTFVCAVGWAHFHWRAWLAFAIYLPVVGALSYSGSKLQSETTKSWLTSFAILIFAFTFWTWAPIFIMVGSVLRRDAILWLLSELPLALRVLFGATYLFVLAEEMYQLKRSLPAVYGMIEILIGLLAAVLVFARASATAAPQLSEILTMAGAVYIIVRGKDNIEKSTENTSVTIRRYLSRISMIPARSAPEEPTVAQSPSSPKSHGTSA